MHAGRSFVTCLAFVHFLLAAQAVWAQENPHLSARIEFKSTSYCVETQEALIGNNWGTVTDKTLNLSIVLVIENRGPELTNVVDVVVNGSNYVARSRADAFKGVYEITTIADEFTQMDKIEKRSAKLLPGQAMTVRIENPIRLPLSAAGDRSLAAGTHFLQLPVRMALSSGDKITSLAILSEPIRFRVLKNPRFRDCHASQSGSEVSTRKITLGGSK
jgi:hypothetical protein